MTKSILTLTLAVLTGAALAQPNDNPHGGTGSVTSQTEFKREIRNANGTGVEATEFFKLTYECSWELVSTEETETKAKPECVLKCNGKKHVKHTDCDLSCDSPCPVKVHKFSFTGRTKYLTRQMEEAERDADRLVLAAGADPHAANWTSYITRSLKNAKRMSEQLKNYAVPCWNDAPCTTWKRFYGLRKYIFRVTGKLTETGFVMSHGVKTPFTARNRGTHTKDVAWVWLPEEDHLDFKVDYHCKCEPAVGKEFGKDTGKVIPGWAPSIWEGFLLWDDEGEWVDDVVKLVVTGIDLNRVLIEVHNDTDRGVNVILGGGLVLIPDDPSFQAMTVLAQTQSFVPAHSSRSFEARAACTEMTKREPTPGTRFTIAKAVNPTLLDLAAITSASHFRGPTDQARVWIATDHATFDEVAKHLLPAPTRGQYLNALYDVARANGADVEAAAFKKCFDPTLLVSPSATPESTAWLVQHLDRTDPSALAQTADKFAPVFGQLLSEKAGQGGLDYFSRLVNQLCSCSSNEGRLAGLTLLLKAVPDDKREDVVKSDALDSLIVETLSEDPKEQEQTLEVIDVYAHKPLAAMAAKLAVLGANGKVKQKAAALTMRLKD